MIYHADTNKRKRVAILISDRADFIARKVIMDKERYCIMINRPILQEDIKILNMYVFINRKSKYMRKKLTQLKEKSANRVIDFNTPLSEIDTSTRQKISKDAAEFNNTINKGNVNYLIKH